MALVATPALPDPITPTHAEPGPAAVPPSSTGAAVPAIPAGLPSASPTDARPALREGPEAGSGTEPLPSYRAAGLFRRCVAGLIDTLLLLPILLLGGLLLCLAMGQPVPRLGELSPDLLVASLLDGSKGGQALLLLSGILSLLYFFLFHAARGQTPGKQALRIMVIDVYGQRPSTWRCLLRTFGYLLSALPFSLGFLWIGFDREKRALHDWLAGTYVVLAP